MIKLGDEEKLTCTQFNEINGKLLSFILTIFVIFNAKKFILLQI